MPDSANSMSQNFGHQQLGSFNFTPNGLQRSQEMMAHQHQHHHQQQQQIPRDKLVRLQGFATPTPTPLASVGEEEPLPLPSAAVYETNGMLSEMFNFPPVAAAAELLEHHSSNFRNVAPPPLLQTNDQWYGSRQGMMVDRGGDVHPQSYHHMSRVNADSEAAMQLFAMNPQPTSPSPPPAAAMNCSSTLHMFPQAAQFQWLNGGNTSEHGGGGQGLSLSLSSSLKGRLEAAKADELKIGDVGNMLFFNTTNHNQGAGAGASSATSSNSVGGAQSHRHNHHHQHHLYSDNFGYPHHQISQHHQLTMGLRNSKYAKATQELLEEFCSVGKGYDRFKNKNSHKFGNPNTWKCGDSSSSSKDPPLLSPSEKTEHQRRRVKLLSMLDEVDRRYNHYCEQMQTVVNSFDVTMGYGAAVPYTALAQKAMSRHFRCLKDAIAAQVRHSCELLGDKDGGGSGASGSGGGITKGETPRLRLLEQSLRQQRAFHHVGMGMMEQEAWRPQRGLPERSVNILRAWLFEHFLHPYPSDADKLLLARQTGLSRNQVSNWFINARVRLWKPMVEDMYQQESKEDDDQNDAVAASEDTEMKPSQSHSQSHSHSQNSSTSGHHHAQTPTTIPTTTTATGKGSETNAAPDSDTSLLAINRQRSFSENQASHQQLAAATHNFAVGDAFPALHAMPQSQGLAATPSIHSELQRHHNHRVGGVEDACRRGSIVGTATYGTTSAGGPDVAGSAHLIRFGTTAGDVSLTLGLRHAGNQPEQTHFSVGGFGRC